MPEFFNSIVIEHLSRLFEKSEEAKNSNYLSYLSVGYIKTIHREALFNWVLDLSPSLNFSVSTGLLACTYIDRFLSIKPDFQISVFELLGISSLSLAIKFTEGKTITPHAIHKLLDSRYSIDAIVTIELYILKILDWNLSMVSPCELIDTIINFSLDHPCIGKIIDACHSFAVFCYLDPEIAVNGNCSLAFASIMLALDRLGYKEFRNNWILSLEKTFMLDTEKLDVVVSRVQKKFEVFNN
ncbi:hypothetical protein SteCoe_32981 [Stentor coeruleus]|uniref:Cyclin-like domain-containing protein n=1 Tax=Stentor coeruleus TaxID=5963 RepID=A0A1R2AXR5_9CILI|nr:hypothetical protein SteCoe_32981 [Stentor coeruleus]